MNLSLCFYYIKLGLSLNVHKLTSSIKTTHMLMNSLFLKKMNNISLHKYSR